MSTPNIVVFPTPLQRDLDHQLAKDFDSLREQIGKLSNFCTRLKIILRILILIMVINFLVIGYEIQASWHDFENWMLLTFCCLSVTKVMVIILYLQTNRTWHLENRVLFKKLELIRETGPLLAYSQQISELKWAETRIELSKYGI